MILIRKSEYLVSLKEFHPISYYNVIYKIITKVLVNRLSPFLAELIGPMNVSFILDGALQTILSQRRMRKTKSKKGVMAFKVHLEKAYDRVNWNFLKRTLLDFGIPTLFTELIMYCVRSSSLSILWNCNRLEKFSPSRGLKQGSPMLPYLFVMFMEKLALHINQKLEEGS